MKESLFLSLGVYSEHKSEKARAILDTLWDICEYRTVLIEGPEQLTENLVDIIFLADIDTIQEALNAFSKIKRRTKRYIPTILVANQDLDVIESFIALPLSAGIQDVITFTDITNKNNAQGIRRSILRAYYRSTYIDGIFNTTNNISHN
jgi:hypothetical protein